MVVLSDRARQQRRADLLALMAVLCWSTVATAFKLSLIYLTPAQLVLTASGVSWLFLGGVLAWRGELPDAWRSLRRHARVSLLLGLLNPALYYLVLLEAYARLPAQEAQALNYTWALTLSLLAAPMLGHRLRAHDLAAAAVCYGGVLVIATRGDVLGMRFSNRAGVLLALGSTLIWSVYWILNARDRRPPVAGLWMNQGAGILLLLVYCGVSGELGHWRVRGLWGGVYVGLVEMGIGLICWLLAMKLTFRTARTAHLIFLSPPIALIWIHVVLRERILASTLVGLALVLGGLYIQRRAEDHPLPPVRDP